MDTETVTDFAKRISQTPGEIHSRLQTPAAKDAKGPEWETAFVEGTQWIKTTYRQEMRKLISHDMEGKGDEHTALRLCELNGQLARLLFLYGRNPNLTKDVAKQTELYNLFFNKEDPRSVASLKVGGNSIENEVNKYLVGVFSTLTAVEMMRKVAAQERPDAKIGLTWLTPIDRLAVGNAKIHIADRNTDVHSKVDLCLRLGDKDAEGKEIVHLIQIKTDSLGGHGIKEVGVLGDLDEEIYQLQQAAESCRPPMKKKSVAFDNPLGNESIERVLERKQQVEAVNDLKDRQQVNQGKPLEVNFFDEDLDKMKKYADNLVKANNGNVVVKTHIMIVPAMDTPYVNNVFGILNPEHQAKVISQFATESHQIMHPTI